MFLVFTKICMPPWRCLLSLGSNVGDGVGTLRLKGGSSAGVGQVAPARFLAGAAKAAPARTLSGEFPLSSSCF